MSKGILGGPFSPTRVSEECCDVAPVAILDARESSLGAREKAMHVGGAPRFSFSGDYNVSKVLLALTLSLFLDPAFWRQVFPT